MGIELGNLTTLVGGTTSPSLELTSIQGTGQFAKEAIDSTHLGTVEAKTKVPEDLYDPGGWDVEGHSIGDFDPDDHDAAQVWTVDIAGSGKTVAASGFITAYDEAIPLNDKVTFAMHIELTGPITRVTA